MYKKLSSFIFLTLVIAIVSIGFFGRVANDDGAKKVNKNDHYKYIAANQILMWVSNNGDGSHDPRTDGNGFYWPGGEDATLSAVFEDGLVFAGKVGREIRMNGNTHRQGLQAGKILESGLADDPSLEKYRVYRIKKGWESLPEGTDKENFARDYNEWPVEDGAPYDDNNGNGVYDEGIDTPSFLGDEVVWYVSNDLDAARSTFTYGSLPMGLEFQTTIFAFNRTGDLGDILFKKYKIINKGNNTIREMILGMWSDTDLGDAGDDYTGCDIDLSLGYTYNGDEEDPYMPPAAMGYDFFQGPIVPSDDPLAVELNLPDSAKFLGSWRKGFSNLPMTAFAFYINGSSVYSDPAQGNYQGTIEFYNYLQGKVWDGSPFIDPNTGEETIFVLTGDPVAGTGWYEGEGWVGGPAPGDRRHLMASGPFTMFPGDTQEVVVGFVIAQGATDALSSITELKRKDGAAQIAYDLDFVLADPPPNPTVSVYTDDQIITLYWDDTAEVYEEIDPLIIGRGFSDTTYTFQGYRLWQFSDAAQNDPKIITTWDVVDSITQIWNYQPINGQNVLVPEIILANEGIQRFYTITTDLYTNSTVLNGKSYFYSVTAFGDSPFSVPTYLESPPIVVEAVPAAKKIDYSSPYETNEAVIAEAVANPDGKLYGDAKVTFKVIDPDGLTGDTYKVEFSGTVDSLVYSLTNTNTGDVLVKDKDKYLSLLRDPLTGWYIPRNDTAGAPLYEGFQFFVQNLGADSISQTTNNYRVKEIVELVDPSGNAVADPTNVWDSYNSDGTFMVKSKGPGNFIWQTPSRFENLGYGSYEIRFTGESDYYITGYQFSTAPVTKSDTVATAADGTTRLKLPFEIWDLGLTPDDPSDDKRLTIKVKDYDRANPSLAVPDHKYTQFANGDYEELFVYYDENHYGPNNDQEIPYESGNSRREAHNFGNFVFSGTLPAANSGAVLRMNTYMPIMPGAVYQATMQAANNNDLAEAKKNVDKISVYPNPYFASHANELNKYQRYVRFIGLPKQVTIRIYSLSGVFVQKLVKENNSQFLDWNLLNKDNLPVASGMYLAYLDMPGVGTKVMKIAIIQEQQYIDRL